MAILASLPPHLNLFSSLPKTPPPPPPQPPHPPPSSHPPPIPIPKYPPKPKPNPNPKPNHPSFTKIPHTRTKYYKPISPTTPHNQETPHKREREIIIGENGVSYLLPDAPFEYQFSYSQVPKAKPLAIREPPFLPFAPPSMPRPWTGKAPLLSKKQKEMKKLGKKISLFKSCGGGDGLNVKLEMGREFEMGREVCLDNRSRDEIIGAPLSRAEVKSLVTPLLSDNRQVNLGRDGLTHNMLELIHSHWKRQKVCKVKCKGVPTVDMDNVCNCLEDKTGGKIIHRSGGVVYLFRGRNYNYRTRPKYPIMLWKPAAPVYPKLIQDAPEGLTKQEADVLRRKGKKLLPICKLAKNGVYISLVDDVKHAFEGSELVKIDCRGLDPSDYKKIGAKLMELVPCVLLSFDEEQILMWRGRDWKSMYPDMPLSILPSTNDDLDDSGKSDNDSDASQPNIVRSSPRMMSLWKRALDSKKALLLSETDVGPDALLQKVEEFEGVSQAMEHSYPAMLISNEDGTSNLASQVKVSKDDEEFGDLFGDDEYVEFEEYESDPLEAADNLASLDSLPIDHIAKRLLNQ